MRHASLFSGIGGFDLAAERAGFENVFHCEINPFCRQLLKYYWPHAESYTDITKTDFSVWRGRIDILTGGFPCQGFSVAGLREGTEYHSYLWPEMRRACQQLRPAWVIGENVTGLISMEDKSGIYRDVFHVMESRKIVRFDTVDHYEAIYTRQAKMLIASICEDLEEDGYEVQPLVIPACGKEAPHIRERVWIIAYNHRYGQRRNNRSEKDRHEANENESEEIQRQWLWDECGGNGSKRDVADATGFGRVQADRRAETRFAYQESGNGRLSADTGRIAGHRRENKQQGYYPDG